MTDLDWRAPGVAPPPSPVLTAALARLDAAYDALLAIPPTTLSDEDLTRLVDDEHGATGIFPRSTHVSPATRFIALPCVAP